MINLLNRDSEIYEKICEEIKTSGIFPQNFHHRRLELSDSNEDQFKLKVIKLVVSLGKNGFVILVTDINKDENAKLVSVLSEI